MNHRPEMPGRGTSTRARSALPGALLALSLLAGCGTQLGDAPGQPARAVEVPQDPVVAFAARATPGAVELVQTAQGPARVTVQRAYHAASGRECREVLVGSGLQERARLVCLDGHRWVEARPLLRGGGATP